MLGTGESQTMQLSIIVPILNERPGLPDLLQRLQALQYHGAEVIIVDGGSSDGSATVAETAGFTVFHSERGRARQMNVGAAKASGDTLLFLHADTHWPEDITHHIEQALADSRHRWGRFDVNISGQPSMLRVIATLMNLRSRLTGIATGDQALFMTRAIYDSVGGFPEQPLMEDIEICKRLRQHTPPVCLTVRVTTSGRRWEQCGVWRTIFLMWRLRWASARRYSS